MDVVVSNNIYNILEGWKALGREIVMETILFDNTVVLV